MWPRSAQPAGLVWSRTVACFTWDSASTSSPWDRVNVGLKLKLTVTPQYHTSVNCLPPLLQYYNAVSIMYYMNTRAKVLSVGGETEMFEITAGLLQGDTLAPFLPPLPQYYRWFPSPAYEFSCLYNMTTLSAVFPIPLFCHQSRERRYWGGGRGGRRLY